MIHHPELGEIKVLLEYNNNQHSFKLVKSHYRVNYGWYGARGFSWSGKAYYYVLWGNEDNLRTMGITELLTPSGLKPSFKSCVNKFHKMVKTSDEVNFKR